jgi:DNA-binding transcriptional LysR family regulator
MDDLEGLSVFVAVIDSGGFAAAARRLHLTKSAVSKQIGRLEARLHARLLLRNTRRVTLTEAGEAFLGHARRALAESAAGREAVVDLGTAPRGLLRLTAPIAFGILHVAPAIAPFLARYPEVRIDVVFDDRLQDLVAGGFDLAIRSGALGGVSTHLVRRLVTSGAVLCASPAYLARRGEPRAPADLFTHDMLLHSHYPGDDEWRFDGPQGPTSVTVQPRYSSNNSLAVLAAALGGAGVLFLPEFLVSEDLAAGRLVRVLAAWRLPRFELHAVFPDRAYVPLKARAFADFLQARFSEESYWTRGVRGQQPDISPDNAGGQPCEVPVDA